MALFRVLFPSWRFFEKLGQVPKLEYCLQNTPDQSGTWVEPFDPEPRPFGALFLNPRGNLRIACRSLVDHLMNDINELDDSQVEKITEQISYLLVLNLVRDHLRRTRPGLREAKFRIRLTVSFPESSHQPEEQMLLSPLHEL